MPNYELTHLIHHQLGPIRLAKNRGMKPIARCEPRACAQRPVRVGPNLKLNNPINTISGTSTFDSAPVFNGSDTSDGDSGPQAGTQIEQDRIIAGAYSRSIQFKWYALIT
jgi:hypothetical protein